MPLLGDPVGEIMGCPGIAGLAGVRWIRNKSGTRQYRIVRKRRASEPPDVVTGKLNLAIKRNRIRFSQRRICRQPPVRPTSRVRYSEHSNARLDRISERTIEGNFDDLRGAAPPGDRPLELVSAATGGQFGELGRIEGLR